MRHVSRGSGGAPAALTKKNRQNQTELERVRAHMAQPLAPGKKRKSFGFSAYKEDEVKRRLEALFFGKCAYCESLYKTNAPVDVEHFRPKGAVEGSSHEGYWWLAADWENLLPSCIDCNRRRKQATPKSGAVTGVGHATRIMQTGKKDAFPVEGVRLVAEQILKSDIDAEKAYLLDPTRDNPDDHLQFHLDPDNPISLVLPKPNATTAGGALPASGSKTSHDDVINDARAHGLSPRGAVSIQIYGLNRLGLVQARTRVLRHLNFLEEVLIEVIDLAETVDSKAATDLTLEPVVARLNLLRDRILREMSDMAKPDAPFSAMVGAWLSDFKARLNSSP